MQKISLYIFSQIDEGKLFRLANGLFWLASFLIFFVMGVSNVDPDFAWHLRVGQDIALEKQAPSVEKYLFPTLGENWVDHEWLSNLLLFLIYNLFGKFGYWVLGFFFALVATFTLILILKITRKYFVKNLGHWDFFFLSSLFTTFGIFSFFGSYGIRLQVLSWLFSVLCFLFYFKISKEEKWQYLAAFPLLFFFWANLHGTFVLGLAISLLLLAFLFWQHTKISFRKKILLSGVATIFATFLTPYGLDLWKLIMIEYTQNSSYLLLIFEWLPLYAIPFIHWRATFYITVFLFIFILFLFFRKIPKKPSLVLYLTFLFFLLLSAIQARRFVPMFVLGSLPFAIFVMATFIKREIIGKWFGFLTIFVAIPIIFYQLFIVTTLPLNPFAQNSSMTPHSALIFLKNNPKFSEHNIYNTYGWGGYLVLMWPEKLHFIDGRMPQKPLVDGITFIEEYFKFQESGTLAEEKLTKYDIKLVLLEKQKPLKEKFSRFEIFMLEKLFLFDFSKVDEHNSLRNFLGENWETVYVDDISIIYAKPELK